jgi:hypothetical protein
VPIEERVDFPAAGARARRLKRFERDLHAWLATPEGRFAAWYAHTAIAADERGLEQARQRQYRRSCTCGRRWSPAPADGAR